MSTESIWVHDFDDDAFSLALYVADDEANDGIKAWFENCERIKDYPPLESKFPGLRWLDQVDKLRHSKGPQAGSSKKVPKLEPMICVKV